MEIEPTKVWLNDDVYPERVKLVMGKKAPAHLYMKGNPELLKLPSVGFCGSRKSSSKGLDMVRDCIEQLSDNNFVIVSGNAAGVDFEAHFNALKRGGKTIFVLPEGMRYFRIKRAFESVWDWENVLVISQFEPDAIWRFYRAMTRNQLMIALSRAMILIEAGEKGGTLNAGMVTLKSKLPLFVADYLDMSVDAKGNKILLDMGASKLVESGNNNRANMQPVIEQMKNDAIIKSFTQQAPLL